MRIVFSVFLVVVVAVVVASVGRVDATWYGLGCNAKTGSNGTLPFCSKTKPCTQINPLVPEDSITAPVFNPGECTALTFDDGPRKVEKVLNRNRFYCLYMPPTASKTTKVPLLIWFPPSGANATSFYTTTKLRKLAESFDISGGTVNGYALVSFQPWNRHWPTDKQDGTKQDYFFYNVKRNSDYVFADLVIDRLVKGGKINPSRIFVSGWSNGAFFGMQYGILRHRVATTAGNKVAAVAVYSGSDPYVSSTLIGNCAIPYPRSAVPIYVIGRDCDLVDCPGAMTWMSTTLPQTIGDTNLKHTIINNHGVEVTECKTPCGIVEATANHILFPSLTYQKDLLNFLAQHPL